MQCIIEKVKLKELKMVNNTMNIQIRKARIDDLEQIDNIEKTLEHRILSYDLLKNTIGKDTYFYFVAIVNNIIVGYISAEILVDHIDILSVAVFKAYTRQNIATMLLNELFKTCSTYNIKNIFLEVRPSNFAAIKLYEKNGFKKISTRKNYYTDTNEDAYIYLTEMV